jgi:hypothetical protein
MKLTKKLEMGIVIVGAIILLSAFKISVTTGFALVIGLIVGSLVEKLK